jgi:CheY-like chemotaxis protein
VKEIDLSKRILVVEDDEELQEYYVMMFEGLDYQVIQALDGKEALEKLGEVAPDLIILDILLDEMMGDALFVQLKRDPLYAEIPVVIASVLPPESNKELLGMDPKTVYLQKPFTRRQLLEVVKGDRYAGPAVSA